MISAKAVKELRELSGAGMMDCKKALQEAMVIQKKQWKFLEKMVLLKLKRK